MRVCVCESLSLSLSRILSPSFCLFSSLLVTLPDVGKVSRLRFWLMANGAAVAQPGGTAGLRQRRRLHNTLAL